MKYPKMDAGTRRRLSVSALDGGLDTSRAADRIGDNQLTGCRNLWWRDGALRTRPGIRALTEEAAQTEAGVTLEFAAEDAVDPDDEGRAVPVRRFIRRKSAENGEEISVGTMGYDGTVRTQTAAFSGSGGRSLTFDYRAGAAEWGIETDGVLVLDSSKRVLARLADGSGYADLSDQLYAPLLWKNGRGGANYGDVQEPVGSSPEAPNMLTGRFRAQYTTDDAATAFYLPVKGLDDTAVKAEYVDVQGYVVTHTVPPGAVRGAAGADGLVMNCVRAWGCVYFVSAETGAPQAIPSAGTENNLTITASRTDETLRDLVYGMGFCTWFGGDRSAKNGGSRLYLAGNPAAPATICWSAPGNPLYFPADNRALVGDAGQAVRAFGRQGDRLVIFKDRELLGASYAASDTPSAGFPLVQLHPGVGCGAPATAALCGDGLVWVFDGKVYGLSGGKVRHLSAAVDRELAALPASVWDGASAAAYAGGWLLLAGQKLFYLDLEREQPAWYLWDAADTGLELKRLLACNDALAQEAYRNFQAMELDRGETPALFAYDGIQYKYMTPGLFTQEQLDYVKEHLRILSGFYGVLRPFDGVSPVSYTHLFLG